MIPQGPIYFKIRSDVLTAFPGGSRANSQNRITFSDWLLAGSGSYLVQSLDSKNIVIIAAPVDISSAILTDIELLSNHCFEQLQEIIRFHVDGEQRSDAWAVVTIYYFAFFTAQVFLRLIGSPAMFIDQKQISNIKTLGGSSKGGPGAGAYYMQKSQDLSVSSAEYYLTKANNQKIHEATWIKVFSYIESLIQDPLLCTLPNEVLFYKLLSTRSLHKIYDIGWPSLVRTRANYRPGFVYREVERDILAKVKKLLNNWKKMDEAGLISTLDAAVTDCVATTDASFSEHARLLHDIGISLFILSRQLYSELLVRTEIDKRWEHKRAQFLKRMSFEEGQFSEIVNTFV